MDTNISSIPTMAGKLKTEVKGLADSMSEASGVVSDRVKQMADGAAATAERASDFIEEGGLSDIADRAKAYLKANPSHALIGAAVVGFVIGRLMTRE